MYQSIIKLGIYLVFLWSTASAVAQAVVHTSTYNVEDNLPNRTIWKSDFDHKGFLWMTTNDGVSRFDGRSFLNFNNQNALDLYINHTATEQLLFVNETELLLNSPQTNFLDLFNTESYAVEKINLPINAIGRIVWRLIPSKNGTTPSILIALEKDHTWQIYRYTIRQNFTFLLALEQAHNDSELILEALDNDQFIAATASQAIQIYNYKGEAIQQLPPIVIPKNDDYQHLGKLEIATAKCPKYGQLYVAFYDIPYVFVYNFEYQKWQKPIPLSNNTSYCRNIWEDEKGNILLASTSRSGEPHPDIEHLQLYTSERILKPYDFILKDIDKKINHIKAKNFEDVLHIATHNGFYKISQNKNTIYTPFSQAKLKATFGASMRGMTKDTNGIVYISREINNWYAFDPKTATFDTLELRTAKNNALIKRWNDATDLIYLEAKNSIIGSFCFGQGTDYYLALYNITTQQTTLFELESKLPDGGKVKSIAKAKKGGIWLGVNNNEGGHIFYFDIKSKQLKSHRIQGKIAVPGAKIKYLLEDSQQNLWIGSHRAGLSKWNSNDNSLQKFEASKEGQTISSNHIMVIQEAQNGDILIGSNGGFDILNPVTKTITNYTKSNDGLVSNKVCGIIETAEGNFWISTFNGLSFFNRKSQSFKNFYQQDGLSENEFNRFSFLQDDDGQLYFGGINGLNIFKEVNLIYDRAIPPPVLTKFQKYNSQEDRLYTQQNQLASLNSINLEPQDQYFQLSFALPTYYDPPKHQFSTWLEGYDKTWTLLGETANVRYNKLPAGTYTLHIKGMDDRGNWSNTALEIIIHVQEVFYKTWYFLLLMAALFGFIVYAILRYRHLQRLKNEQLRTKLSSDLHDEVSGLLSGIAMQSDLLEFKVEQPEVKEKIRNIATISRAAMSRMSDVLWSIDARQDSCEDLILRMKEHVSEVLYPLDIHCTFQIENINPNKELSTHLRQNLYFIFKEAINNIAKHANATKVTVSVGNTPTHFLLQIKDNGQSQATSAKQGQGLSNMKMRAKAIKAQLDIENIDGYTISLKRAKL